MILSKSEAEDVIYGNSDTFTEALKGTVQITNNGRWTISKEGIFQHIESGKFYKFDWHIGATECQDQEPFYEETYEPTEVELKEVTVEKWVVVK